MLVYQRLLTRNFSAIFSIKLASPGRCSAGGRGGSDLAWAGVLIMHRYTANGFVGLYICYKIFIWLFFQGVIITPSPHHETMV